MRLTFDFDDVPTEDEIEIIIDIVKAYPKSAVNDKIYLGVKGRGASFSMDQNAIDCTEIDIVSEVVTALVTELRKEIELENGKKETGKPLTN